MGAPNMKTSGMPYLVWEDQRHNLPQNYLAFHDIPASSLNKIDSFPIFRGENNAHHIAIVCCMLDL